MPELPEVETVRRIVDPHVVLQHIVGVTLHDFPAVLESTLPAIDPASALVGRTVLRTDRRGKYLAFVLDQDLYLIVHLRMTGRLILAPSPAERIRFEHAAIHLSGGHDLRFGDQRKFGRLTLATSDDWQALDRRLGPEPFSPRLTAKTLHAALMRRPGPIKNALLDQHLIAGLGNIYVDEALYRSRINPLQPARDLSAADLGRLLRAIRFVLQLSLRNQGTTFATFENPYGESGSNATFLRAYDRARKGQACPRCGTPFVRIVVAGRGTSYCPTCQPLPAPPSQETA
jgi:formamidopyrimidine-DNA glycosylase